MLYALCLLAVIGALLLEESSLRRARAAVPVRIHVHGTRGKSSAVRRTAELLRAGGLKVLAKTTGDAPELIYPDGRVETLGRRGPARISEQGRTLRLAARMGCDAVVIEGMALQRETIAFSERMIRATHAAVVNVRPDHAETMGWTPQSVAETISGVIPGRGGVLFVSDEDSGPLVRAAAAAGVECRVVPSDPLLQSESVARAVAAEVLKRQPSLPPGGAVVHGPSVFEANGVRFTVADFMSANDVRSTELLCRAFMREASPGEFRAALLATRADRPLRTLSFLRGLSAANDWDLCAVAGSHSGFARIYARLKGGALAGLEALGGRPAEMLAEIAGKARRAGRDSVRLVCMGNVHGEGEILRRWLGDRMRGQHAH